MPSPNPRRWLPLVRLLPKSLLSHAAGIVAGLNLPRPLRAPAYRAFGRAVGVDFSELRDPLADHASLQAFFTRALADGVRPLAPGEDTLVAPCDGAWGQAGRIEDGTLLQVKGREYRLAELIRDEALARSMEGGQYATFYLAPRDYHRFHAPCAGFVTRVAHVPGSLWPVNAIGLQGIDRLFARNERICAYLNLAGTVGPRADLCLVAVGATLVGKIRLRFDDLSSHRRGAEPSERAYPDPGIGLERGAEWGHFEFGSTLVMAGRAGAFELDVREPGTPVRMGERIGRFHPAGSS
ncbi:MAG: archaetidylserine decarboxylase [Myxococcota bacterium]|nr:archaetidylserine decarboxylase [Myxococcota bacterium]